MTTQETEKELEVVEKEEQPRKAQKNEMLEKVLSEAKDIFSLQNLTVSLLSALLVIGAGYGSGYITQFIQTKFYSNPTMYTIFTVTIFAIYLWAIIGPVLIYATRTKKWTSIAYIMLFEIAWLAIFITVLFFTTPTKEIDPYQYLQ